jgi:nitrogen regulatory protein PII
MIKVEAVVARDLIETVIDAVEDEVGRIGMTVTEAAGHGGRSSELVPEALLMLIVSEAKAERVATLIAGAARSGHASGDGLVWMSPVYGVTHSRTGKPLHEYVEPSFAEVVTR